jgi:membrane-bound metal-dependent hydrolase YbcI (DUF457 family)
MFAVGHMALAYLLGKGSAKPLKINPNVPALLVLSIIPDIDILAGGDLHRGPTHSVIVAIVVFIPFFIIYRKKAAPYFLALLSHAAIGDLLVGGGVQLFWPITTAKVSLYPLIPKIAITSPLNVALETTLFIAATIIMYKTRDLHSFFQNKKTNLLLTIPIATVLLPTFLAYPLTVPLPLAAPHLLYLALFTVSVLIALRALGKRSSQPAHPL